MIPVLLLDGGFSNELVKRCSYDVDKEPLWTAKALLTDQKAVTDTHFSYLNAGADIIETATYQATIKGLEEGLKKSPKECEELIQNSVMLAKSAVTKYKALQDAGLTERQRTYKPLNVPLIAGSIGPYGVYLHDGSEYNGSYMAKVSETDIIDLHSKRIELLVNSNVDFLAIETLPSLLEAEVILKFIEKQKLDVKVWVSFTLQEKDPSRTVCGELITDAFKTISKYPNVWGFGTNCVNPQSVSSFLKSISQVKREMGENKIRLIVYPNVGRTWISGQGWSDEDVPPIADYAIEWMELGANVIGVMETRTMNDHSQRIFEYRTMMENAGDGISHGCCQVGADQIQKLRCVVDKWNSQQKDSLKNSS